MQQGYFLFLKEFDEPINLLETPDSAFRSLVMETGSIGTAELTKIAKQVGNI